MVTAAGEEVRAPAASGGGWHARPAAIVELGLVLALLLCAVTVLRYQGQRQSFSVDESRWIATSRYFWITFVERDVLGPAWQPNYLVLTHPPVARYLIGFGLWLQGWTPDQLNGRYDTDRSRAFNRRMGNIPSAELLAAARRVVLVFAVAATMLLYPIGRSVGGPLSGAAAVALALAHPLLATLWTRALAESILAFFALLALVLAIRLAGSSGRRWTRFAQSLGVGAALGLATATKLSGALVGVGLALFVLARQAVRWPVARPWDGLGPWIDAALAAVLAFVLVNPLLYPNPVLRTVLLFDHRRDEMEQQALGTPRLAVPDDLTARAELMYRRTFLDWGVVEHWTAVPIDAPLAAAGLAVAAAATWCTIRRGELPGPPALVVCWALATFTLTTLNFGFDSSHYIAPPATVTVVLQALALAWAARLALRTVWRREPTEQR